MTTEAPATAETFELAFCTVCQQAYAYVDSRTWSPCHGDDATVRFNLGLFLDLVQTMTQTVLPFFKALVGDYGLSLVEVAEKLHEFLQVSALEGQEPPPQRSRRTPPDSTPASAQTPTAAAASPGPQGEQAPTPAGRPKRSGGPAGSPEHSGASAPAAPAGEKAEAT